MGKGECEIIESGYKFSSLVYSFQIKFRRNYSSILDFKESFNKSCSSY
jgi:hypothetical protein